MAATSDSGLGHGTNGSPQGTIDEMIYPAQAEANENLGGSEKPPVYDPSPKHDEGGWGSRNPIKTQEEGQRLLDTGIPDGKQRYNVTDDGIIVKFQPDNTPNNGYHSYEVSKPRDIPPGILKQLLETGKITRVEYNKFRKEMIMSMVLPREIANFSMQYEFFDDEHKTQISMLINGDNILSFERESQNLTTRWNLDELALWLRKFIDHMTDDPYPVEVEGDYAAIKDINAREFDTDDDEAFDAYYDQLDEWNSRHRWHPTSEGAILADVYFQMVGDHVEISWNNQDSEEEVTFKHMLGGVSVSKKQFIQEMDSFLKAYADHWF